MTWAEPGWWGLAAVVAALAALVVWMQRHHVARLAGAFGPVILERVFPSAVRRRRVARDVLALLGLLALVGALAEPRFGKRLRDIEANGVDLVLAVDLSRSMDARDTDPSRLERARREILDLMTLLEGDRVGLVMYAGGAYPRMPLTLDYRALDMIVRELDTRVFQAQGSALGAAIRESLKLLAGQQGEAGQAILVLTDGEIHEPDDALAAAREAAAAGVTVYGLVIGQEAAPIPNGDSTFLTDPSTGTRVMTAPDTTVITEVARATGGAVLRSVPGNEDVLALYRDEIRTRLRSAVGRRGQREQWNTAFQWPLGAGVALLLLSAWIGDGRRKLLIASALFALFALPGGAHAQDTATVRDGDLAYRAGRYQDAVRIFTELSLEDDADPDLFGRLGAARYRAGDYNGAARAFERQAELSGDVDAEFNAGNAYYQSGRFDRAVEAYDRVLAREPEHPGAAQNRQLVLAEKEQRRLQQQQQQQQQQAESGGSSEDEPQQGEQTAEGGEEPPPEGDQQPSEGSSDQQPPESQDGQAQAPENEDEQDRSDDASQSSSGQGQQQEQQDGGTREEGAEDTPTDLQDVQPKDEGQAGEATEPQGEPTQTPGATGPGGMTQDQADRVLDGVEEGRPRVYIPGERSSKPW